MTFGDPRTPPPSVLPWDEAQIKPCSKCGHKTYPEHMWAVMSKVDRAISGGRMREGQVCLHCVRGYEKSQAEPAPGDELVEPQCSECETYMVTARQWREAGPGERQELLEEGYRVQRNVKLVLCDRCDYARRRAA